ncbi:MAG: RNase H family protein, partial [Planctomycetota bacterium]
MTDAELLMAVYQSVAWDDLYDLTPDVERDEVDDLFLRLRDAIESGRLSAESETRDKDADGVDVPDEAILRCDGASSGNPGPAGIGMALYHTGGEEIQAWGIPIGKETNNVAEYRAMIAGLHRALNVGVTSI